MSTIVFNENGQARLILSDSATITGDIVQDGEINYQLTFEPAIVKNVTVTQPMEQITLVGGQVLQTPITAVSNVPQTITRFQALAVLHNAGLLAQAQAAVTASTDPLVGLAWNNAQSFERNSPMLASLAATLNITATQLDNLFIEGAGISA